MFNAVLFTMAKLWKQLQFSTSEERIKKMWYLHSMDIFQSYKRIRHFCAGKWMELESIMLCKVSHIQKDTGHMFSLTHGT
jgi:hypothetical protein